MIVPENGLILESTGNRLEISFDWLMYREAVSVLATAMAVSGRNSRYDLTSWIRSTEAIYRYNAIRRKNIFRRISVRISLSRKRITFSTLKTMH